MLRYQRIFNSPDQNLENQTSTDRSHTYNRPLSHNLCDAAAVIARIFGKVIATVNALWLISFSIFEYAGLYKNCWCASDAISVHNRGWVLIFKKGPDLAPYVLESWYGSVVSSFLMTFINAACLAGDFIIT